jgi:hypothetical protein
VNTILIFPLISDEQNLLLERNCNTLISKVDTVSNYDKKIDVSNITDTKIQTTIYKNNTSKIFSNLSSVEEVISQFTDSIISDNEGTEINVQEIKTDSDKTESDLIEDISSQLLESAFKQKSNSISQKISNPSSISSESLENIQECNSIVIETTESQQRVEAFTPSDPIHTVSTLESKADYGKPSYILQNIFEGKKKRKNHKKYVIIYISLSFSLKYL